MDEGTVGAAILAIVAALLTIRIVYRRRHTPPAPHPGAGLDAPDADLDELVQLDILSDNKLDGDIDPRD